VLVAKAFRSWYLYAAVLRDIKEFVLRKAESIVASALLV
jgi:hypothetical protein